MVSYWIQCVCLAGLLQNFALASDVIYDSAGFEKERVAQKPSQWITFPHGGKPSVKVVAGRGYSSDKAVQGVRSEAGGLTALTREFEKPQQRILIEFVFAFSKTKGRSLNLWTHEPAGRDASQLNLCIQNGALMQFDGRTNTWETITRKVKASEDPDHPVWHRIRIAVDSKQPGIDYWISNPGEKQLPDAPITRQVYRGDLLLGAIDLVSGRRIAPGAWYLVDDLRVFGGMDLPKPHPVPPLPEELTLWSGPPIPKDVSRIPFVTGMRHQTIHQATEKTDKFLHGAAILQHKGVWYANWANSPLNENGPHETLRGRRSTDQGQTWSELEIIAPGFTGNQRHSHGILFVHQGAIWTICARWGIGDSGRRFRGLKSEAFVLDSKSDRWKSQGIVMDNCWPYDEPKRMKNGNFITGGQDKNGLPVVATSHGDDVTKWDTVSIPFDPQLNPSYAETTVWVGEKKVVAVIRGGRNVAWVATSEDFGHSWSKARPSNFPMPRAKAYAGHLSSGQRYLVSNLKNRDTLVISVSKPGEETLSKIFRIRHGKSIPPRFAGQSKSKQWSYPYAHEHDGKLYVVYSMGKEDCGLTVLPIDSLKVDSQ